jgi:hypothetical protein
LETASGESKAHTFHRLADCLRARFERNQSFVEVDKAVEYSELCNAELEPESLSYPGHLNYLATCLLLRSKLGTNESEKDNDSRKAVQVCKKALQLLIGNGQGLGTPFLETQGHGLILPPASTNQAPNNFDANRTVTSELSFIDPDIFDILETMTIAIHQTSMKLEPDFNQLINRCQHALTRAEKPTALMWETIGDALFQCHKEGKADRETLSDNTAVNEIMTSHYLLEAIDCYNNAVSLSRNDSCNRRHTTNVIINYDE